MGGAIYFCTAKFWESISGYLIDCVYIDFARRLYSIGALHIPKNVPRSSAWFVGHAYFILGKLRDFVWKLG